MKQSITELAEIAVDELDRAAVLMYRQIKSGELNKQIADKSIIAAQKSARRVHRAYFSRKEHSTVQDGNAHLRELSAFNGSELYEKYNFLNDRFGKVLKCYAASVGAEFKSARERVSDAASV